MRLTTPQASQSELDRENATMARDPLGFSHRPSPTILGILSKKERWGLSKPGWLLVASIVVVVSYLAIKGIHPFLAVTHRANANVLVVEGWVHKYAIRAGAEEFKNGRYERIFAAGGPVEGNGGYINDYQTSASVGAEALKKVGVPQDAIEMVPSHVVGRDRTYSSAIALREWIRDHNLTVISMNVLTEDCHARRTQLLYQKAFGRNVAVGIISIANPDYDARYWWRYSDGVREVIGESIAYIYAKFFFHPSASSTDEKSTDTSSTAAARQ